MKVIRYIADISKAKKAFGFDPKVPFGEGVKRAVEWYQKKCINGLMKQMGRYLTNLKNKFKFALWIVLPLWNAPLRQGADSPSHSITSSMQRPPTCEMLPDNTRILKY